MNKDVKPDCETPFDMAAEKNSIFMGLTLLNVIF